MAESYIHPLKGILKPIKDSQQVYLWDVNRPRTGRRVTFLLDEEQERRQFKMATDFEDLFFGVQRSTRKSYKDADEVFRPQRQGGCAATWNLLCFCCTTTKCCGRHRMVSRRPAFTDVDVIEKGVKKKTPDSEVPKDLVENEGEEPKSAKEEIKVNIHIACNEIEERRDEGIKEEEAVETKSGQDEPIKEKTPTDVAQQEKDDTIEKGDDNFQEDKADDDQQEEKADDDQQEEKADDDQQKEKADDDQHKEKADDDQQKDKTDDDQHKEKADDDQQKNKADDDQQKDKADDDQQEEKADDDQQKEKADDDQHKEKADDDQQKDKTDDDQHKEKADDDQQKDKADDDQQKNKAGDDQQKDKAGSQIVEATGTKRKRGKLSRFRRFLRRLCCCCCKGMD